MTKRRETGSGIRRTALDVQDICLAQAKLLSVAVDDLTDGDNDNRRALRALNALGLNNIGIFDVHVSLADGQLADAELIAMRLAASDAPAKPGTGALKP